MPHPPILHSSLLPLVISCRVVVPYHWNEKKNIHFGDKLLQAGAKMMFTFCFRIIFIVGALLLRIITLCCLLMIFFLFCSKIASFIRTAPHSC